MGEFRFKQFTISNDRAAMKVGTDGVLLGAWSEYRDTDRKMLDVGTGTGVIALIAAQRYAAMKCNCRIEAIDIDEDAVGEARDNFANSPWPDCLSAQNISLQELASDISAHSSFDLIISNPPYFENSLKAPDQQRTLARHTDTLSFAELLGSANLLLKGDGRLTLILPYDSLPQIRAIAVAECLKISRISVVRTTPAKEPKRVLIELVKSALPTNVKNSELIIQSAGAYSDEYIYLTGDLYPKF